MKKFLTFPIITVAVLVILAITAITSGNFSFDMFNPTKPKLFIERTLPGITQAWDVDNLYQKMSGVEKGKVDELSGDLKRMFGSCKVETIAWKQTRFQTGTWYIYDADLNCEHCKAVANLIVTPQGDDYKYIGFHVSRGTK